MTSYYFKGMTFRQQHFHGKNHFSLVAPKTLNFTEFVFNMGSFNMSFMEFVFTMTRS